MDITAVVLSANDYPMSYAGIEVLTHRSRIRSPAELQAARHAAVNRVQTSHFFFLDDDDDLPLDVQEVLAKCLNADKPLVYTDEWIRYPDGTEKLTERKPYTQAAHLADPLLVHHLVLCQTREAQEAIKRIPRGHYCPELLLYWEMAKRGTAYVPRIGYIWNKGHGMHTWPATVLSQGRALLYNRKNP